MNISSLIMYSISVNIRATPDMDKGETPFGMFLDLSKTFDTLNHTILLIN